MLGVGQEANTTKPCSQAPSVCAPPPSQISVYLSLQVPVSDAALVLTERGRPSGEAYAQLFAMRDARRLLGCHHKMHFGEVALGMRGGGQLRVTMSSEVTMLRDRRARQAVLQGSQLVALQGWVPLSPLHRNPPK